MTEKIDAWMSSDGKIFRSEQEAIDHENNSQFIQWCEVNLKYSDPDEIGKDILEHWNVSKKE